MAKDKIKNYILQDGVCIEIDESKCLSCGSCTITAPNTFELDKKLMVKVKDQAPFDDLKIIEEACLSCPTEAIKIQSIKK